MGVTVSRISDLENLQKVCIAQFITEEVKTTSESAISK